MIRNKISLLTIFIVSMAFICFSNGSAFAATAAPDFYTTDEDNPTININDAANGLLQNDGDVLPLTVVIAGPTSVNGVPITFEADGRFTYTPNADLVTTLNALASGESFVDTFNYGMTDSAPSGTTGLVTITITGVNDAPTADAGGAYTINEGQDLTLDASGSSDVDSTDTLSYAWDLDNDGTYDDATGSGPTVTWTALIGLGLATDGSASTIALQVSDGKGGVDTASTTLTINNVAPVVTETGGDQTVDEGSEATNSGTFSDIGDDTVTITASIGSITQDTGASGNWSWSYTPSDGPSGPTVVTITATDSDGATGTDTFTLTVNNVAPVVTETGGDQTVNEGSEATNNGTFSDVGDDTVTITASIGSINQDAGSSGNWSWSYTPSDGPSGPTVVTITATDSDGATGTDTFTLTVNNVAPVVTETGGNQTVNEGSEATNNGTFSDVGDDTVTITASIGSINQDAGSSGNWNWSYTPSDGPSGPTVVTITATDSDGATGTDTFTLTVNNIAPVVTETGGNQTVNEGSEATNNGTFSDIGDDTVTITASIGSITQDAGSSGNWSWSYTPTDGPAGPTVVTITATDSDGATGTDTFNLTVNNVAPVVTAPADQTADEGTSKTFDLGTFTDAGSGDTHVGYVNWGDGGSTRYLGDVTSPDITASATDPANTAHAYADNGTYTVQVWVNDDDGGSSSITFTVTVNNVAPAVMAADDQTIDEGTLLDLSGSPYAATYTDPGSSDTHAATIDWGDGNTDGPGAVSGGNVDGTHTYADNSTYTVTITVEDNDGGSSSDTLTVTVNNVAPTANADTSTANEDGPAVTIDLTVNDTDPGADDPEISSIGLLANGTLGTVTINPDNDTVEYDPNGQFESLAVGEAGEDKFDYEIDDGNGGTATATVTVTINGANDAPTAVDDSGAEYSTDEATSFSTGNVLTNDTDPDTSDVLSVDSVDATSANGASIANNGDGTFTYNPNSQFENLASGQTATDTFNYIVADGNGGTDTGTVTIEITGINDEPTLDDPSDVVINEDPGAAQIVTLTGIDEGASGAENSQTLTISATSSHPTIIPHPTISYTEDSDTGTLSFTPLPNTNTTISGPITITVRVQDNGGTANGGDNSIERTFDVTVNPVNDMPVFTVGSDQSVDEDAGAQTVAGFITDIDDGDPEVVQALTFTVTNDNNTLFSSQPSIDSSGQLTYTPADNANGSAIVSVALTDDGTAGGAELTSTQTFKITVGSVNDMPSFTKGGDQIIDENISAEQTITSWATDIDDGDPEIEQTLTFNVINTNNDLFSVQPAIDGETGTLTYTVAENYSGIATVTVTLTDDATAGGDALTTDPQTFTITVTQINDMPEFTGGPNLDVDEDSGTHTITEWATGIDDGDPEVVQSLTFNVVNDNPGMFTYQPAIDSDGTLTFTLAENFYGSANVTVSLTDDTTAGGPQLTTATQTFTIFVSNVNDQPSFTKGSDQVVIEGTDTKTVEGWATSIYAGRDNEADQTFTFIVTGNTNSSIFEEQPAIDPAGTLTFKPSNSDRGIADITVVLKDDGGTYGGGLDTSEPQTFRITVLGGSVIHVNPDSYTAMINEGEGLPSQEVTLTNNNLGLFEAIDLSYSVSNSSSGWITCATSGTLAPGESTTFTIQFDTASLTPRAYSVSIIVKDLNIPNRTVIIPVNVNVVGEIDVGDSDDAEENKSGGEMDLYSDDLDLGQSIVGVRFTDIGVPEGSQILGAYITFSAFDTRDAATSLRVYGHNAGDSATFTLNDGDISSRDKTSSSYSWSPDAWFEGQIYKSSNEDETADIRGVVQEIVNHPDWRAGNAMTFIIEGEGLRTADSNESPEGLNPTLNIMYLPVGTPIIAVGQTSFDEWTYEGESPDSQIFTVRNSGSEGLKYTISEDIDWLSVSPTSYSGEDGLLNSDDPQEITITFDTDELESGAEYTDYTGTITVSDPNSANESVEIYVNVSVHNKIPQLSVDNDYIGITAYEKTTDFTENPVSQSFEISNTGRGDMIYTITDDADWLTIPSGITNGTLSDNGEGSSQKITLNFNSDSLGVGTYEAHITITGKDGDNNDANNSPVTVTVSLTIETLPLSRICGDVPVYTENLVSPAIMILLDSSGSMDSNVYIDPPVYSSPDIKDIVQHIVNRTDWNSGQDMGFIIGGTGERSAYSHDGSSSRAPLLHVEFSSGSVINLRINDDYNDAEESSNGDMTSNSNDLDFGNDKLVGLRFTNVQIPRDAVITEAHLEFIAYESDDADTDLIIYGWDVADVPSFYRSWWQGSLPDDYLSDQDKTTGIPWSDVEEWVKPTVQTRMTVAKEALKELVTDPTISWGFGSWTAHPWYDPYYGYRSSQEWTKIHVGCEYWSDDHEDDLVDAINAMTSLGNTPLTPSMRAGLDYFAGNRSADIGGTFNSVDCQPKFIILITDGLGNTGTTLSNVESTAASYGLDANEVNLVGIGFALDDATQLDIIAEESNASGDEDPDDNLYALHELDEDGNPKPFIAMNKEELVEALSKITSGIKAEVFHGSAPAPTTSVDYGDIVITAKFQPTNWSGDLEATQIKDNGTEETLWLASEQMPHTPDAYSVDTNDDVVSYSTASLDLPEMCADKKLGDIINSKPIIIEDPAYSYSFDNYFRSYKYAVERDPLVYVGSNDGALHAFLLTDKYAEDGTTVLAHGGEEVWRFYPKAVQDNLRKADDDIHWDRCGDSYCHRYFVDGSPIVADVYDSTETKWKTMLVSGLREGGAAYFALDISYGKSFGYTADTTKRSKYMWEFTDSELGQTWADPEIKRVAVDGSTEKAWGVFFGSGYSPDSQSTKEAYLYGIEANYKADLWKDTFGSSINKVKISSSVLQNDALSPPMTVDMEGDIIADLIYTGNLYGSMYRVENIGQGMTPEVSILYDSENSTDHGHPIRAKSDYAYASEGDGVRICFGTGRYEDQSDKTSTAQQYFFSLQDDSTVTDPYTYDDLVQLDAKFTTYEDVVYRTVEGTNENKESWVVKLAISKEDISNDALFASERVIAKPLVVAGVVFFTTFIPDENVCEGNGQAYLFALDYETGLPPTEPIFDINGDGVVDYRDVIDGVIPSGIFLGEGQPSEPVLHKDTIYVTTTGTGLTRRKVNLSKQLTNMTSWKEKNTQ